MKKRFLSVFLLSCMLMTVSCTDGDVTVTETVGGSETAGETTLAPDTDSESEDTAYDGENSESQSDTESDVQEPDPEAPEATVNNYYAPTIPDDLRFDGGEINILGMEKLVEGSNGTEDAPVAAVSQALYDRNRRCEERFGIELKFTNIQTNWAEEIPQKVRQSVQSGSNDYDVVFATQAVQNPLILEGCYLPLREYDLWIDLEQPWWNKGYIESISLNTDASYSLLGNLTYNQPERTAAVFANVTKLFDQHNISGDDLFNLVLEGKWTLDKFTELVNLGYRDLNKNNVVDEGDMFGLADSVGKDFLAYSAGLEFTKRDEDGYPVLDLNNDRSELLADKLVALFANNQNVISLSNMEHLNYFGDGNALFICNRLYVAGWQQLRDMKDEFVILPYPKFDESVDGYHSVVETLVQIGCVTTMADDEDLEMISAALEQMCYDGYMNVTPVFYKNDLKLDYKRGEDADTQSKIIDMIVSGARTDFIYANDPGKIKNIFSSCIYSGKNNFKKYYDTNAVNAEEAIQNMIEEYEKNLY